MFSKICKNDLLENIYFDVNSFLTKNIDKIGQLEIFLFKLMELITYTMKQNTKLKK